MGGAASGVHDLHVACSRAPLVAEAVLVRDRAFADVGDDFHVGLGLRRETAVRRDAVVVPDAQAAPAHSRRFVIAREREMEMPIQPTVAGGAYWRKAARSVQ